jgi:flagellin-like protein
MQLSREILMKKREIKKKIWKFNKSQSEIISSLLLILLVIAAIAIIAGFVRSIVIDNLSKADCLDVAGKVEISEGYTCYNPDATPKEIQVQVHIEDIRDVIEGFAIEIGGATTNSYKILNNSVIFNIEMCNQSTVLYLPGNNEERTYTISSAEKPTSIRVYPILKGGRLCDNSDSKTDIQECIVQSRKCTP